MKNLKPLKKNGLCGIYNLANVLRDEDILGFEDDPKCLPLGIKDANEVLNLVGYDGAELTYFVSSVNYKQQIPKDFLLSIVGDFNHKSDYVTPLILSVQVNSLAGDEGLHAVSLLMHNGKIIFSDPIDEEFIKIDSLDYIFKRYEYVNQVLCLYNPTNEGYLEINKDRFFDNELEIFNL